MHYTQLKDTTGGTLVTWGMKGDNNFISRAMCAVMPFEKMMGRDFEKGLTMLTEVMAADPSAAGLRVETGDFPAARYLGVRGTMSFDKIDSFYTQNLPAVFEALTKAGATMASAPTGLYFEWDETTNMTTMAAAIAFAGDLKAPAGMEIIEVPASRMARIDYYGSYDDLGNAHTEMDKYFMANNLEQTPPVIEEYVTDPGEEPDQSRWLTRITYLIK